MSHARHAHGPLVRVLREAEGLTLTGLGRSTGLSPGYLSRIERGERVATWDNTLAIAHALAVHPGYLTGQRPPFLVLRTRLATDQSREEFAASVGLEEIDLMRIELGSVTPDPDTLARIAQRLGVSVHVLSPVLASTE